MNEYTVQIDAGNEDRTIWQSLEPSEGIFGESPEAVADWTAVNNNIAEEGSVWRVNVWEGPEADTSREPAYTLYSDNVS